MAEDPISPHFIPLPSSADVVSSPDGSFITFPPFPIAEGVIMPFKDFKQGGICIEPGPDDAEVDTLGIPTVAIRTRHTTDQCKTKTKRKVDARGKKGKKSKPIEQRLWWEQWEDAEAMRFCTGFNPYSSEYEKIIAAAADFASGRVWPVNFPSESGPKFIWEKFQRYLGVHEGASLPSAKQAKVIEEEAADFDDDDMDEDEEEDVGPGIVPDPVTGLIDVKKIQVPTPGKPTAEQKLKAFFNNPEKSIKIFMSSYSRSMGYIWANANLDCIPRVLRYFVNFLLRSKVLPQIENQLRRSLEVIAIAMVELPNTSHIAKAFPDKFSMACNSCWGKKADGYMMLDISKEELVNDTALEEPEAKRQKCDTDVPQPATEETVDDNTLEEPEAKRQKCDKDVPQPAAPVEPEPEPEKETPPETTDTWSTGGDWGAATEGWGQGITAVDDENSGWAQLEIDKPENLFSFLGPTAFPITHSPGIVERSMRRIVSITRPPPSVAKSPPLPEGIYEPNANAVELELDRRFAKVVLTPMIDWDGGESPVYTKPLILATSRGAVVVAQDNNTPVSPTPVQGNSPQPPHNPERDDITLLIDNIDSQVDYLREGMAIGGTWVQLVREGEPVVAKKKKGKSKKSSYWYLDELALVVPSFWTIIDD